MLPVVLALAAITVARVRVWRIAEGSHSLTAAMMAFTVAGFMFLPEIGERFIDPRTWWGENLSTLIQHVCMVIGFYALGAVGFAETTALTYWRISAAVAVTTLVVTYRIGPEYSTPATEFAFSSAASLASQAILLAFGAATCVILMIHAAAGMRPEHGRGFRKSMAMLAGVAVAGLCWALTTAALLAAAPSFIHSHYHEVTSAWAAPAFLALAGSGLPGFLAAWRYRHDPSRRRR